MTQTDGVTWDVPLVSFTITTGGVIGALTDEREFTRPAGFEVIISEAGAVLSAGVKADLEVLADMELAGWSVVGDQSGTIQFDLWVDSYANFPPTVADTIVGTGTKPNLAAGAKNQGTVSGYGTLKLTKGQWIRVNVDSSPTPASITRVTLVLKGYRA